MMQRTHSALMKKFEPNPKNMLQFCYRLRTFAYAWIVDNLSCVCTYFASQLCVWFQPLEIYQLIIIWEPQGWNIISKNKNTVE